MVGSRDNTVQYPPSKDGAGVSIRLSVYHIVITDYYTGLALTFHGGPGGVKQQCGPKGGGGGKERHPQRSCAASSNPRT